MFYCHGLTKKQKHELLNLMDPFVHELPVWYSKIFWFACLQGICIK